LWSSGKKLSLKDVWHFSVVGDGQKRCCVVLAMAGQGEVHRTEAIKDNLLALGIDVDIHLIERLQKLGLNSTLQSTSRAADSVRSRNPYGMSSAIIYQNIEDPTEYIFQEKKEVELEWHPVDTHRVWQIVAEIYRFEDQVESRSIIELIEHMRLQYIRSPDRFIERMLGSIKTKVVSIYLCLDPHASLRDGSGLAIL
jgi:hypothetical protein